MIQKQNISAIVAVGPDNVIGLNGVMPWHSRQDFYHFKKMTIGNPCIFGKTTFFNLPKHPLPKRLNIICSSSYQDELIEDCFFASSLENAIKYCYGLPQVFVCGGGALYKYSFDKDLIDTVYLTQISSPCLSWSVAKNPGAFTRFPFDISTYFDSNKWSNEQIVYPSGVLPVETSCVTTEFFKYVRTR